MVHKGCDPQSLTLRVCVHEGRRIRKNPWDDLELNALSQMSDAVCEH